MHGGYYIKLDFYFVETTLSYACTAVAAAIVIQSHRIAIHFQIKTYARTQTQKLQQQQQQQRQTIIFIY